METATAERVHFVERRRAGSRPPRGTVFVERRRPVPVPMVDVDDLHDADLDALLTAALDERYDALAEVRALTQVIGRSGPVGMLAHDLGL